MGEQKRLEESRVRKAHWKRWGPYLAERAWGTVREDYSGTGDAWGYFPHEQARSRAYRWNEDGIAGICDRHQVICFALALWNGKDRILKERLFGVSGPEGNHGEDVKELYYYLDSTPTHSFMRYLYKYPQAAYPYEELVAMSRRRGKHETEHELLDTGLFAEDRYFDVEVTYAKGGPEDVLVRIAVTNRGPERAPVELLPTLWFRNTWSWSRGAKRPELHADGAGKIAVRHPRYAARALHYSGAPELLFTENESNNKRLFGSENASPYVKDAFHDYVVGGVQSAVNPAGKGTKVAVRYRFELAPGETRAVELRLTPLDVGAGVGADFEQILRARREDADVFYADVIPQSLSEDGRRVMRQALSGLLWSKQHYHYVVEHWLEGDPAQPKPPAKRKEGRNAVWRHLYNDDVISMPDKWEYPWYAAWDLAFHCIPLAMVDPDFAKDQLLLMLREWYMHPSGQLPAYEWALGDVNPPVHAWAALRVYRIEKKRRGKGDRGFLERVFQKLMLNFTWWVNRKDAEGRNVFQGGFLGLDNIGVFDRSAPLPTGGHLEQSDGTSWMGMYCLNMLAIAMELAAENEAYEDVASKFWEHFVYVAHAMNTLGLWDEDDGFYYDVLRRPDGQPVPMKVRSMVGLIPLFAVETLDAEVLERLGSMKRRMDWFLDNRPELVKNAADMRRVGDHGRRLMSIVGEARLARLLRVMLDETEFLSPWGIRSLSRRHRDAPFRMFVHGREHRVDYEPGESQTGIFGGNSNWRGPVWMPVNYLLIESLQKFHHYLGDGYKVELPTGSGNFVTLDEVARELSRRLVRLFLRDGSGRRVVNGGIDKLDHDPHFRDLVSFYEYFHGDDGRGLGASHQTGWTALVAKLLQQSGE
jgi:hypothetical protein